MLLDAEPIDIYIFSNTNPLSPLFGRLGVVIRVISLNRLRIIRLNRGLTCRERV